MRVTRGIRRPPSALLVVLALSVLLLAPPGADAQHREPAPAVGDVAPEFELVGATRYGVLRAPVRLSDFRGKTVVLAFFFRARTPG